MEEKIHDEPELRGLDCVLGPVVTEGSIARDYQLEVTIETRGRVSSF